MFSKTTSFARNSFVTLRHFRQISLSYFHNPGSEPLVQATLGDVLYDTANKYPGRVAVRSVHEDLTLTYEELLIRADKLGNALRAQGLEKGDRIGIWSHNNSDWIIALVAAARIGVISVALNPVYEKSELSYCIKKTGIKSILIGQQLPNRDYYNLLSSLIPELHSSKPGALKSKDFPTLNSIITCEKNSFPGTFTLDSLIAEYSNSGTTNFGEEVKPDDGSIIFFTSGSTGNPKAAVISHLGVVNNSYFIGKRNQFHEDHCKVCLQAPLFHVLGSVITLLGAFSHGSTLVIAAPTYNVTSNLHALVAEGCTAITGTPTMYVDLLTAIRRKGNVPLKLKTAMYGGSPCSPQLLNDVKTHLKVPFVLALYGLTESTASIFQSLPNDSIDTVAETVGYVHDHTEVKVVDENGNQVPFGSAGELLSRGYNNMICYWDDPEKTKSTIDKDGWLYTGDKFTICEDGYGKIVGRIKELIIRGGENIAPKEIEDLLNTHPDIIESQVIGVSDDRLGEELCAVLRVREGVNIRSQDVSKFCSGKLARFKIPRMVKLIEEFPKTASGKIQKYKIKDLVESGKL